MKNKFRYIAAALLLSGMLSAQINVDEMPKPGPTPTINIQKPKTFTLSNGLTVMVVENNKLPRVNASLTIDRPPVYEGKVSGVGEIMSDQLGTGTAKYTKDQFNKRVDYLGASINFSSEGAFANTLSKYFPEVLGLMSDAISNPKFSADEVQKSKDRMIEGLKAGEKSASEIAGRVYNALTYGKNTSRGEMVTESTVKAIQVPDVQEYYNRYYAPDNAYLVIVGDVKFSEVKSLVEKNFSGWKKSNFKFPALEASSNVPKTEIDVVDVPNAVQSIINVGNLTDLKMNNPQFFAATIANYILGGGGEARLFMNLREKNGFTYGAYSRLSTSKYTPRFSANSSVRNEVTDKAVVEFMNELKGITAVEPEELSNAKEKLKGDFIRSLERPETIARFAVNQKTQNLPDNFYTDYLKSIDKVSVADVSAAAKSVILPNQTRILVVGKGSEINEGLEKLGYPVKYFDKEANPTAKPEVQKIASDVTVATVGENYIKAIGGSAAVQKINSVTMNAAAKVQNMDLNLTTVETSKGQKKIEAKMMGATVQKVVFDGKTGYMEMQGNKKEMDDETKKEYAEDKELFPELVYGKSTVYTLSGIEKFGDEDAYVVKKDNESTYYSVKTGLKIGTLKVRKGPAGQEILVPAKYWDYKEVSGVKMPFAFSQNMGGMEVNFQVSSYEVNKATDADFK